MKTGVVVWFTGLPSSGKSTLANQTQKALHNLGIYCALLDSDEIRAVLFPSLGYGEDERQAFYEKLSRLAALLAKQKLIVLVAATAHQKVYRELARSFVPHFLEVYLETELEECTKRDTKGLYQRAKSEKTLSLPGMDISYEIPENPEIRAKGGFDSNAVLSILGMLAEIA